MLWLIGNYLGKKKVWLVLQWLHSKKIHAEIKTGRRYLKRFFVAQIFCKWNVVRAMAFEWQTSLMFVHLNVKQKQSMSIEWLDPSPLHFEFRYYYIVRATDMRDCDAEKWSKTESMKETLRSQPIFWRHFYKYNERDERFINNRSAWWKTYGQRI